MGGEDIPEEGVGCRAVKVETPGILGTRQSRQRSRKAGRGWKMTAPPAQAGPNQRTPARRPAPRPAEGRGQVSGGHLAAAPGTVCGQPVSPTGPQIPHFPARRGVVSACVGVVFTHHPRCDDGPCPAPPEEEPAQKKEPAGICSAPYKLPWLGGRRDLCEQKHS